MPRLLLLVLVALAVATVSAQGAAPVPVTATQRAAILRLNGYVTELVGFTRTVSTGIGVKTVRIRALRASIVSWRRTDARRFGGRLVPVAQLATTAAAVLGALDDVETRGGNAATTRYGSTVIAFDRAVTRYSALRFVQRSR